SPQIFQRGSSAVLFNGWLRSRQLENVTTQPKIVRRDATIQPTEHPDWNIVGAGTENAKSFFSHNGIL
ncbi:MAG TPA: hypothetical protein DCP63_14235, partial [Bacteroidetes bacterium]|nr:hypothetical protein [Bacteroidota bacterium]